MIRRHATEAPEMDESRRQQFLRHQRIALGQIDPTIEFVGNRMENLADEGKVRNAEIWLAASYFEKFREEDFEDIPAEKRNQLAKNVQRFVAIANEVPKTRPA